MKAQAIFAALAVTLFPAQAEVGSLACAKCHLKIYETYQRTAMARSSGAVAPPAQFGPALFASPGGSVQYRVAETWTATTAGISVTRGFDYFIGSGAVGRSYIEWVDNYLFQSPVSYYSSDRTWRVSPGFERSETLQVSRPVEASCLGCHSSGVQLVAGTVNQYARPPFREDGISCERCHGSGEQHIRTGAKSAIVNPARLGADARDSVCAQCHLSGEVRVAKANSAKPYAPGDLLSTTTTAFLWDPPSARQVNGHVEELSRSRCSIASAGKLWCGTCHDPHSTPQSPVEFYRERCFGCHSVNSCSLPKAERASISDHCISCHMPRSSVRDVQHAAYTDHTIPKRLTRQPEGIPELKAFGGDAAPRELAIARSLIALRENNRLLAAKAAPGLLVSWNRDNKDTASGSQLAQFYDRLGREEMACEIYGKIAKTSLPPPAAENNWGACLAKAGRLVEAISFWDDVTKRAPGEESAWTNLAIAEVQVGETARAAATKERGLRFHPASKKLLEINTQR